MRQLLAADFTGMSPADIERMVVAAGLNDRTDRLVAFGPVGSMEAAEYLFERRLTVRALGNEQGVVIVPSGPADREIFLELTVRHGSEREHFLMLEEIANTTDKVKSLPLDKETYGARPRVSYMSYQGFEFLTGIMKFSQVKELIQTSHFAPHAFLSIIRPLYLAFQDASHIWVIQPMPDTQTEYIHHRRLVVFKGIRKECRVAGKVITLNKAEKDLGICHSHDVLVQYPGGGGHVTHNHDVAYMRILSLLSPSARHMDRVEQGAIYCNTLSDGYSHLINLGRANRGQFAVVFTRYRRINDLLIESGLATIPQKQNRYVAGIGFFDMHGSSLHGHLRGKAPTVGRPPARGQGST